MNNSPKSDRILTPVEVDMVIRRSRQMRAEYLSSAVRRAFRALTLRKSTIGVAEVV